MRRLMIILIGFTLLMNTSSAYSLSILQPNNNAVFYPGQKVKVVIEAASNEDIVGIVVSATSKGSSSEVILRGGKEIANDRNIDIRATYLGDGTLWPRDKEEWRHNDIYNVAYPYTFPMFDDFVAKTK